MNIPTNPVTIVTIASSPKSAGVSSRASTTVPTSRIAVLPTCPPTASAPPRAACPRRTAIGPNGSGPPRTPARAAAAVVAPPRRSLSSRAGNTRRAARIACGRHVRHRDPSS